jgi:two-component system, NtrC family, response regulator AtoC
LVVRPTSAQPLLLAWSDRGVEGPSPSHHARRPASDRGPVLRLLEQDESRGRYGELWVLTTPAGEGPARALMREAEPLVGRVELRALPVDDPSDYNWLFRALRPIAREIGRGAERPIDVLLSSGTPQVQTLWVVLVQAGLLRARMLQVIPAAFVPNPHPRAVREVRLEVEGFPEIRALREEVQKLRAQVAPRPGAMVGESEAMRELRARLARVAASDLPTLVLGETGTGKELVARALHEGGARAKGPFVAENCGAIAEGLLASELFGHEAGAFTGASRAHRGLFERAEGGTVFLDEVGEMPLRLQSMLLRVLQEGVVRRVGAERGVKVDARVVCATHRDLVAMVKRGEFREDLYYRLRGVTLEVPPLRARYGDVPALVAAFVDEARAFRPGGAALSVSPEATRLLQRYAWPGNVRELRAEVHRWAVFCDGRVEPGDLAPEVRGLATPPPAPSAAPGAGPPSSRARPATLAEAVEAAERAALDRALDATGGNLSQSARALGIDRNTLKRKMAAFGLRKAAPE